MTSSNGSFQQILLFGLLGLAGLRKSREGFCKWEGVVCGLFPGAPAFGWKEAGKGSAVGVNFLGNPSIVIPCHGYYFNASYFFPTLLALYVITIFAHYILYYRISPNALWLFFI